MAQTETSSLVARNATQSTNDLGRGLLLLGTFGSSADPQALLKLRNGRTKSVSRGDSVNGKTVIAIEEGRVALTGNGDTEWLEMPAPSS
ncbi:hypothetical protein [Marivita hallyeonensis]|uniref:Type IV pilus biogenesis n=1 Tax=Marivita hallyeonensis TaxID=996342 RepID=A0A1M5VWQ4_9RHOB|nr:hypothetical protein [Marivita hallyeonensis]SHH79631.1 hypothetical protein SAMN05443551_3121 [Marivita hallyeonensis]